MNARGGSAKQMKRLAMMMMLAALALIALVNYERYAITKMALPRMFVPIGDSRILLVFDREIWTLDADGHRTAVSAAEELALAGKITSAAATADGQALVSSLGSPVLLKIDPVSLSVTERITLSWPPEFQNLYRRSVYLATAPNGDIAVSAADHVVLLFGTDGSFKAHTPPDTYRFTNGLFYSPQGWWTTDTHRSTLRLLDAATMQPLREISLQDPGRYYMPTFMTAPSASAGKTGGGAVATVARMEKTLKSGHVADVFADGTFADYNAEPFGRLSDLAWFNGQLLALDAKKLRIERFNGAHEQISDFGDAELREALHQMRQKRNYWQGLPGNALLGAAIVMLLAGLLAYQRHQKLQRTAEPANDVKWRVGTPEVPKAAFIRYQFKIAAPVMCLTILAAMFPSMAPLIKPAFTAEGQLIILAAALVLMLTTIAAAFFAVARKMRRIRNDAQYEGLLNYHGVRWLNDYGDWNRVRLPGEVPRESTILTEELRAQWLLITTQRVLLFRTVSMARRLYKQWPRAALTFAQLSPNGLMRLQMGRDAVEGRCPSTVTAERIVALLNRTRPRLPSAPAAAFAAADKGRDKTAPSETRRWHQRLPAQCAASAVLPGVGQFMQDRFATGLLFFIGGSVFLAIVLFMAWTTFWAPAKSAVPAPFLFPMVVCWLFYVCISVTDTWRFGQKEPLP